jgi:hypothetical protein
MPWVGFEPKIPASERAETAHALDRSTTVTGKESLLYWNIQFLVPHLHAAYTHAGVWQSSN